MTISNGNSESFDKDDIMVKSQISLKDHHMIHTLLKISTKLDQNTLCITKETKKNLNDSPNWRDINVY
jgi:hypothetical protein